MRLLRSAVFLAALPLCGQRFTFEVASIKPSNLMRLLALAIAVVLPLAAQDFTFEVASIKLNNSNSGNVGVGTTRGGLKTENTSLHDLIRHALNVQTYQVTGGPAWVRDLRFDVTATNDRAEEAEIPETDRKNLEARAERTRARLRSLLKERFQLELREEAKEMSVYALGLEKSGEKLKPATLAKDSMSVNRSNLGGSIRGDGIPLARLCETLGSILERPVVDETGLAGIYDVEVKFTADGGTREPEDGNSPGIFTALKEQLGLKLTGKKAPVSTWVVMKAEKPGEN